LRLDCETRKGYARKSYGLREAGRKGKENFKGETIFKPRPF